jgi:uncharacterized protein (TIGR03435 family)
VKSLITTAYTLYANGRTNPLNDPLILLAPIEGGPAWINSDRYSIDAKAEGSATQETMRGPMLRALLEDRFKLKIRRETREVPVYALTVAKNGAKLHPAEEGSCTPFDLTRPAPAPGGKPWCKFSGGARKGPNVTLETRGLSLDEFAKALIMGNSLDRPVINRTGITGTFDFHLEYALDETSPRFRPDSGDAGDPPGPSIFTALQQQLGLKLDPAKGPGEFLVVDRVEKPSEN